MICSSVRKRYLLALSCIALTAMPAWAIDSDLDGVDNATDNCQLLSNADQRDSDADGFGNLCDADFNNDGVVNVVDLGLMRTMFFSSRPHADVLGEHADMNGDGTVNVQDLGLLRIAFALPPGPAGNPTISAADAARFLTQATYGARVEEINALGDLGSFETWIDQQVALTPSYHEPLTRDLMIRMCYNFDQIDGWHQMARLGAWWERALYAPDQLRQRMAFALSQVLVISDRTESLTNSQFGVTDYYDTLVEHAFGNYRDLLEDVTLHAAMGMYLSHIRNERAQPDQNIRPDENFAREIMQLFTIGVQMLNLDGTAQLDDNGDPIPTYTQSDIEEFARVYTGWNYPGIDWGAWEGLSDKRQPMEAWEQYHDDDPKVLFGTPVAGGQTAQQDLDAALDILFNHPNMGPFIASRLIQRLTTSNPSPGYVERVARSFNDNGDGERGDLAAVVRTILLDPEARSGHIFIPQQFGKLREPMLRLTHIRRAFDAIIPQRTGWVYDETEQCGQGEWGYYGIVFGSLSNELGQQPLSSPSVFNFYLPDYAPPGFIRDEGLVAPEFQIYNANTMQSSSRAVTWEIWNEDGWGEGRVKLDVTTEAALADNPDALLDHLDLLMLSGQMSNGVRNRIRNHLTSGLFPDGAEGRNVKAREAIMLLANTPEYLIQK
ncbi:MAG: DUF1800 family protein [Gammaproteobacteria bacterium]